MKTKIEVIKTSYYVNSCKKTVVCLIEFMVKDKIALRSRYMVKGKAKCSEEDKFDEIKGRRIAESRAKAKMYQKVSCIYKQVEKELSEMGNSYKEKSEFCALLSTKETEHVETIMSEV